MSLRTESILYNLQAWLSAEAPGISTVAGGFLSGSPAEVVAIVDNGGEVSVYIDRTDVAIQIIARGVSRVETQRRANELAAIMRGRFGGLELPEVTVEGDIYPAIIAWGFTPQSKPGYIGIDENRLHMWSANFTVIIGG